MKENLKISIVAGVAVGLFSGSAYGLNSTWQGVVSVIMTWAFLAVFYLVDELDV